jgi:small subunit ribosomal protein S16
MSVSIRLSKLGKKHAPSYRVVVTKTRNKRDGAYIEILGHYNPSDHTKEFTIDKKAYEEWVAKGAIVSDAVKKLVDGTYEYIKYEPKKEEVKEEESQKEDNKEE